ncbi:hypothetical protein ACF0H5_006074 [Mactra antiquata]
MTIVIYKMKMLHQIILLMLAITVDSRIDEIPLPTDIQACFDRALHKGNLTTHIGEKLLWHCVHGTLWNRIGANSTISPEAMKWFTSLLQKEYRKAEHNRRLRRQATPRRPAASQLRVRREYRLLTDAERHLFHQAVNMLKYDRSIQPNRFDALGRLHELLGERAHDGPNFLGWHRLFLLLTENALREKIPSVTIPYWDSTLDGDLIDPRSSIIWTPSFLGNGNGRIRTGPFTGWVTPYGPLMRNFGEGGTMMNWTSIRDTFTMNHLADITYPQSDPRSNLEDHHGEPHLWVGGHFAPQALAAYDPVFFLHHSFIDLVWELFRRIQRRRGINPVHDYPSNNTGPPGHHYFDPAGIGTLQNRHALSDLYTTEIYTYQLPPTCSRESPSCGSPYIRCDTSTFRPKCISASVFDTPDDEIFNVEDLTPLRKKRHVEELRKKRHAEEDDSEKSHAVEELRKKRQVEKYVERKRQNDGELRMKRQVEEEIRMNRQAEEEVIKKRQDDEDLRMKRQVVQDNKHVFINNYTHINPYLENIKTWNNLKCQSNNVNDHYENSMTIDGHIDKNQWSYISVGVILKRNMHVDEIATKGTDDSKVAMYDKCKRGSSSPRSLYIESTGLNYLGFYKEIIHLQHRASVNIESHETFIGIKTPDHNPTEVLLTAYDSCGRSCRTYCRNGTRNEYHKCKGSIRLDNDFPKLYGKDKNIISNALWENNGTVSSSLNESNLFIKFVCGDKTTWLW